MDLKFVKIDKKETDDEYIMFKATEDCQLHDYLIHDDTFDSEGELSNKLRHMYRFPKLLVKKGEYVVLFVKKQGKYKKATQGANQFHFLYWGTNTNIFNQDGDKLYLLLIAQTNRVVLTSKG